MSDINEFDEDLNESCQCSSGCECGEHCECNHEQKCSENCTCGDNCDCANNDSEKHKCNCSHECTCGENCECDEITKCSLHCECGESKDDTNQESELEEKEDKQDEDQEEQHNDNPTEYIKDDITADVEDEVDICECGEEHNNFLKDYQRVQAEFDNYRKRMQSALLEARHDGFMDAITSFLPALDSFKMATDMITDKNTLMGIKFIEKGILDTLAKIGVEVIDATGKFNPELHQAIEAEDAEGFESGDIIKEAYKGFTYKGKVIRYSQVIVKR